MKFITLVAFVVLTAIPSYGQILVVNFNTDTNRQGAVMASTDTAGIISATNWNNVASGLGTIADGVQTWNVANLNDSTGVASGVSLTASSTNVQIDGSDPDALWGQGGAVTGNGDSEMFSGGLQIRNDTVKVSLANLDAFAPNGYDLYVYFSAGNSISTTVSTDSSSTSLLPVGYGGTYIDGTGGASGNYVLITGLTEDQLDLTIAATVAFSDSQTNVAGIEIVAVPEPSSYALVGLGLVALIVIVRRRSSQA